MHIHSRSRRWAGGARSQAASERIQAAFERWADAGLCMGAGRMPGCVWALAAVRSDAVCSSWKVVRKRGSSSLGMGRGGHMRLAGVCLGVGCVRMRDAECGVRCDS